MDLSSRKAWKIDVWKLNAFLQRMRQLPDLLHERDSLGPLIGPRGAKATEVRHRSVEPAVRSAGEKERQRNLQRIGDTRDEVRPRLTYPSLALSHRCRGHSDPLGHLFLGQARQVSGLGQPCPYECIRH